MATSLQNQYIDESYQKLVQLSGSLIADGTGSVITNLDLTASQATSASYAVTASYALNVTPHESASYAVSSSYAVSASYALSASQASTATSASLAEASNSTISASYAATASLLLGSVVSASYALSSSHATTADSASTATSASHAVRADGSGTAEDLIITVKNIQASTIAAGVPVYANGVTGENVNVVTASNDSSATMPAIGITQNAINASGNGTVVISGRESGIDTSGLTAGHSVYVGLNGTLTATKPTGSALIQNIGTAAKIDAATGEIIVQGAGRTNDLPNLTTDYVWKGDANGVPQAVASSSIIPTTANTASYVAGANVDGTVANATSASHAINSDTTISASHAVIADSALSATSATSASHAVNADTASFLPNSTRLNITDITASSATFTSASIGYLQTITGSAKIVGDAFIILNNDTPTERYAGVKVQDSGSTTNTASLLWDGQTNDWFYEFSSSATHEYGVVMMGPEYGTLGSPTYPSANTILKGNGNHHLTDSNLLDDGSKISSILPFSSSGGFTGSLHGNADTSTNATSADGVFNSGTALVSGAAATLKNNLPGNNASSTIRSVANLPITNAYGKAFDTYYNEFENYPGGDQQYAMGMIQGFSNSSPFYENVIFTNTDRVTIQNSTSGSISGRNGKLEVRDLYDSTNRTTVQGDLIKVNGGSIQFTGSIDSLNGITAPSFTGSLLGSASYAPSNTADANTWTNTNTFNKQVHGGVTALSIASTTASLDMQEGNFFNLTLANGVDTHLDATNVTAGQTITLVVTNNATAAGTLSFSPDFLFAGGTAPTVTATTSAVDVLTFVTTDATSVYGTGLLNFS
jgi:hypothetical protein